MDDKLGQQRPQVTACERYVNFIHAGPASRHSLQAQLRLHFRQACGEMSQRCLGLLAAIEPVGGLDRGMAEQVLHYGILAGMPDQVQVGCQMAEQVRVHSQAEVAMNARRDLFAQVLRSFRFCFHTGKDGMTSGPSPELRPYFVQIALNHHQRVTR